MAVFAFVLFSSILLSSAASLADPNETPENQIAELRWQPTWFEWGVVRVGTNCDFTGGDIPGARYNIHQSECAQKCEEDSRCLYYSWQSKYFVCYLKNQRGPLQKLNYAECGFIPSRGATVI